MDSLDAMPIKVQINPLNCTKAFKSYVIVLLEFLNSIILLEAIKTDVEKQKVIDLIKFLYNYIILVNNIK